MGMMLKTRIAAERYTRAGDPLHIDCDIAIDRTGRRRCFRRCHWIADVDAAKGLAYSANALRLRV